MNAARIHGYGQPLVIEDVPTPSPAAGEKLSTTERSPW